MSYNVALNAARARTSDRVTVGLPRCSDIEEQQTSTGTSDRVSVGLQWCSDMEGQQTQFVYGVRRVWKLYIAFQC
ncbi:hypothetical protein DPMN_061054 [Dreissena polymorpha]|uniref:Uncharacterized protein n=1 Tax=Dreissena polymorpha TaxID=45954 RepID=A0A9D4C6A9_DREPO|nr:hypothetical protein DPMN_061054 [Dreissena polymorpha]